LQLLIADRCAINYKTAELWASLSASSARGPPRATVVLSLSLLSLPPDCASIRSPYKNNNSYRTIYDIPIASPPPATLIIILGSSQLFTLIIPTRHPFYFPSSPLPIWESALSYTSNPFHFHAHYSRICKYVTQCTRCTPSFSWDFEWSADRLHLSSQIGVRQCAHNPRLFLDFSFYAFAFLYKVTVKPRSVVVSPPVVLVSLVPRSLRISFVGLFSSLILRRVFFCSPFA